MCAIFEQTWFREQLLELQIERIITCPVFWAKHSILAIAENKHPIEIVWKKAKREHLVRKIEFNYVQLSSRVCASVFLLRVLKGDTFQYELDFG